MQLKTTEQAAQLLGIKHETLSIYLSRHPELKPADSLHANLYLWTDAEIEAVREARTQRRPISRK